MFILYHLAEVTVCKMLSLNQILNDKKVPVLIKWGRDHEKDAIISLRKDVQQKRYKKSKWIFLA